jgi:hypothetical protein
VTTDGKLGSVTTDGKLGSVTTDGKLGSVTTDGKLCSVTTDGKLNAVCDRNTSAVNKHKSLFCSTVELNLWKKVEKWYIWSVALCGAENWTLRNVDRKYLRSFETGAGEGWRKSAGPIM